MPRKRQRAKREGMVLPQRRPDGTLDLTPHIASVDMVTKGKYLEIGKGFLVTKRIGIKEVQLNRLREIRKEKGLSQLRLAFMTNIAPNEISRIENGWIKPYPGWRKRFSRALGVSEAELFPDNGSI